MKIEFCLPTHNEEKIIRENVVKLYNFCLNKNYNFLWRIIILDNGSKDKTEEYANELAKKYQDKILVKNIMETGRGRALKKYWLRSEADILAYMDVDLAASLDSLDDLLNPLIDNKADLVIGSRLLPGSKIKRNFLRELSSQSYNFLSRLILGHNFSDLQCGFKAVRTEVFKQYAGHILDNKWFFDTELFYILYFFKKRIIEIPVEWEEERYDQRKSKVKLLRDSFKFIVNLLKLRWRYREVKSQILPSGKLK